MVQKRIFYILLTKYLLWWMFYELKNWIFYLFY